MTHNVCSLGLEIKRCHGLAQVYIWVIIQIEIQIAFEKLKELFRSFEDFPFLIPYLHART